MLGTFKMFVSVMCVIYQGTECLDQISKSKNDKKLDTVLKLLNSESGGSRIIRSALDLKSEDACRNVQRVARYFMDDGPNTISKCVEQNECCRCNECSRECCKCSQSSRNVPSSYTSSEPIVGTSMETDWCPSELFSLNNKFQNNELVGNARESSKTYPYPKQSRAQLVLRDRNIYEIPDLNIEALGTKLVSPYVNIQPQQIALPALTNPIEPSTFYLKRPQIHLTTPLINLQTPSHEIISPHLRPGIHSISLVAPKLQQTGLSHYTTPFYGTPVPSLGLLGLKSPLRSNLNIPWILGASQLHLTPPPIRLQNLAAPQIKAVAPDLGPIALSLPKIQMFNQDDSNLLKLPLGFSSHSVGVPTSRFETFLNVPVTSNTLCPERNSAKFQQHEESVDCQADIDHVETLMEENKAEC